MFPETAGHSGLTVACLTAVRKVLGSKRAVGSCVYRKTIAIYSLGQWRSKGGGGRGGPPRAAHARGRHFEG